MRNIEKWKMWWVWFVAIILLIVFIGIAIMAPDKNNIYVRFQLLALPITTIGVCVGFAQYISSKKRTIQLERAKTSSDFVRRFREQMPVLQMGAEIRSDYLDLDPKFKELKEYLLSCENIMFTEEYFNRLLKKFSLTENEVSKFLKDDPYNKYSEEYFEICQNNIYNSIKPSNNTPFYIEDLLSVHKQKEKIKTEILTVSSKLDEIKTLEDDEASSSKKKNYTKLLNSLEKSDELLHELILRLHRETDTEILNDLEILTMHVKFDLIGVEQIYNLISMPYFRYLKIYYLDIMTSKIKAKKQNYFIFTNIVMLFEKLQAIRLEILETSNEINKKYNHRKNKKMNQIIKSDYSELS